MAMQWLGLGLHRLGYTMAIYLVLQHQVSPPILAYIWDSTQLQDGYFKVRTSSISSSDSNWTRVYR